MSDQQDQPMWMTGAVFEIHLSWQPLDQKNRQRKIVYAVCSSVFDAIDALRERFPTGLEIDQVQKRTMWSNGLVVCPMKSEANDE